MDVSPDASDEELVPAGTAGCLEVKLPTLGEQAMKQDMALQNLKTYVAACGGALPTGWDSSLRFRITTRRHGRQGLTTDNFYYSPCGKTFRTHKQVAEFLGLQPVSRQQLRQQQKPRHLPAPGSPHHFHIVSVTLNTAVQLSRRVHNQCAKRTQSAMLPPAAEEDCIPHTSTGHAAASAPGAFPASTGHTVSANATTAAFSAVEPTHQDRNCKRTKCSIVAKFTSCGNISVSQEPAASLSAESTVSSTGASREIRGNSMSNCQNIALAAPSAAQHDGRDLTALDNHMFSTAAPHVPSTFAAASSTAGSTVSINTGGAAVCSRLAAVSAQKLAQLPSVLQRQHQRQQCLEAQPPSQRKLPQPAAWRSKLRELATKAAAEQGIIPGSSSTSTQHQLGCCPTDV